MLKPTIFLCTTMVSLWALGKNTNDDTINNVCNALIGSVTFLTMIYFLKNRIFVYKRKTWFAQLLFIIMLSYCVLCIFIYCMIFQDITTIVEMVQREISEKELIDSYASWENECDFTFENVFMIDIYVISHFLGWMAFGFIFKDWAIYWLCSLINESLERSLGKVFEHFGECWYDTLFHDVFGANLAGYFIGISASYLLGIQNYDWLGRHGKRSIFEWEIFHSHQKLTATYMLITWFTLHFLTTFFVPNALRYKIADLYIGVSRLVIYAFTCYLSGKECHDDFGKSGDMGELMGGALLMVTLESMIASKFNDYAVIPIKPYAISVSWMCFWGAFFGGPILLYIYLKTNELTEVAIKEPLSTKK